jgi:hypothetical protein
MERKHLRALTLSIAIIIVALAAYIVATQYKIGLGFPLDDAWIHQTYARNLGQHGEWAFLPGQRSAGSTGPLWSVLLSLGYALRIPYKAWTYLLGGLALVALAYLAGAWFSLRVPERSKWRWVAMTVIGLEWHLLWAALSGMETIAMTLVNLAVLYMVERQHKPNAWVGLLIGVGFWLRPEAVLLLLPVAWAVFFNNEISVREKIFGMVGVVGAFMVLVAPYLIMNYVLVGNVWPTTFFAKQAEYAFLRQEPITYRFLRQLIPPLTGVGIVLLPGIILEMARNMRQKTWGQLAPLVWGAVFLGTYALRLPVYYQHGRYAMPVTPVFLVVGLAGMARWLQLNADSIVPRVSSRVWAAVLVFVLLAFVGLGADAYATDVGVIETEMVAASLWIHENTPPQALIAAHDIGALGYFGERQILDLAGLISPEVIPILWDESAITDLLNDRGADYLMTFPGWYPEMIARLPVVFDSEGTFSPSIDGENMAVYAWLGE